ncbi:uncharacterized protein LOC144034662 [Vanacampus margaritifer]
MSSVASRNAGLRRPRRLLCRPRCPVGSWPPSALGRPVFVSFVSKAVLWERPISCRTVRVSPQRPSALCPRFLSHMKSDCQGLRPPCFLSSKPGPQPPSAGRRPPTGPRRAPTGSGHVGADGRACEEVRYAAPSRPDVPPSSTIQNPHSAHLNPRRPQSKAEHVHGGLVPKSGKSGRRPVHGPEPEEPLWEFRLSPTGSERSEAASVSDFSRPSSSLFSRSTDLASGRSSIASDDKKQPSSALANLPERQPTPRKAEAGFLPLNDVPTGPHNVRRPSSKHEDTIEGPIDDVPPLDSHHALSPRLASRRTPFADPRRWPVLPPIPPLKGRGDSPTASPDSNTQPSDAHSDPFDELDAIAPSSLSSGRASDSVCSGDSPGREVSLCAGMSTLTVGCQSRNLGSLSRVRLLLLQQRTSPESTPESTPGGGEGDRFLPDVWTPHRDDTVALQGPMETTDLWWKVPEDDSSDWSMGGSRSPSSRLTNPSPSRGRLSCRPSPEQGCDVELADQTGAFAGGEPPDAGAEESDYDFVEARKHKVLKMLYNLQDPSKRIPDSVRVCSDFDDFDFLAKFCIFSPEKLEEYKRAFQAEDADADGYISCIQVVDALKQIVPADLLSDEEEIYVYRILALVDFRVTDGLVDVRLFAVIASLAQKIAAMDDFMRSLVTNMDFRSLEVRLFKVKQLFLFLLEERRAEAGGRRGFISAEQLALELKAGGIRPAQEAAIARQLRKLPPLDLIDFLAYLPLFMLIHTSVVANPLDDAPQL